MSSATFTSEDTDKTVVNSSAFPSEGKVTRQEIDASCGIPVLVFYTTAVIWLLVGSLLGFLASFKMHDPQTLTGLFGIDFGWLNFGRIRPAHLNVVGYGWANIAGVGTAIWLMARLSGTTLRYPLLVTAAGVLYNIGVLSGTIGILIGQGNSIEWLEFPPYATFMIFLAYAIIGIWAVDMFMNRTTKHVYVSQWYLMAGFFWFPWLYGTAQILLLDPLWSEPASGAVQGIVNWWYGHNALGLWFTPIGLATAYYMIPKVIGRPVHSYHLSFIGFWTLAFFYAWNGAHHLIGGPVPAWIVTASVVASVMMVIPVCTVAINHHITMKGHFHLLKYSPTLRFVVFGAMAYTLTSLQGSMMAVPYINKTTHFTHYTVGHAHIGLYGFFTMVMFGAMYYIVPRLVGSEWKSARLINIHFWLSAAGILLMFGVLTLGGWIQGVLLNDASWNFSEITQITIPWLRGRSLSGAMLTIAHLVFAFHFMLMIFSPVTGGKGPMLFAKPETK